jgi:hypothetical protein
MVTRRNRDDSSIPASVRSRLLALLDAVDADPTPGPHPVENPALLVALNYFDEAVWLPAWRAWQYEGGPKPPSVVGLSHHRDGWLCWHSDAWAVEALREVAKRSFGRVGE